jgi:hypothetical protein
MNLDNGKYSFVDLCYKISSEQPNKYVIVVVYNDTNSSSSDMYVCDDVGIGLDLLLKMNDYDILEHKDSSIESTFTIKRRRQYEDYYEAYKVTIFSSVENIVVVNQILSGICKRLQEAKEESWTYMEERKLRRSALRDLCSLLWMLRGEDKDDSNTDSENEGSEN